MISMAEDLQAQLAGEITRVRALMTKFRRALTAKSAKRVIGLDVGRGQTLLDTDCRDEEKLRKAIADLRYWGLKND